MVKSEKNAAAPGPGSSREERLVWARKVAATKQTALVFWPGKAKDKKDGDELVGVLLDAQRRPNKRPDGTVEDQTVYSFRNEAGEVVQVRGAPVLESEMKRENVGVGDEVMVRYRGQQQGASGRRFNDYAVVVLSRAGEHA